MSHTRLFVVATIIAGIIIASFVLSVPHTRDIPAELSAFSAAPAVRAVTLRDTYKKGKHTITGSIEAPDACAVVSAQASLVGDASSTQSILVEVSMSEDSDICLERVTTVRFSADIAAPARLPITATVNGVAATTTVL